ncbi:MAG: hypothetical protein WBV82_28755 [Myxococcaceae bacterium]
MEVPALRVLYEAAVQLPEGFTNMKRPHKPREMNADADEIRNRADDERLECGAGAFASVAVPGRGSASPWREGWSWEQTPRGTW